MFRVTSAGRLGSCAVLVMACLLIGQGVVWGQDKKAAAKPGSQAAAGESGKLSGRLPQYYGAVVTPEQKQQIYKIQTEYGPKISELQSQIDQLTKQREEKISALLSAEQKEKLAQIKAEAAAKRKATKAAPPSK